MSGIMASVMKRILGACAAPIRREPMGGTDRRSPGRPMLPGSACARCRRAASETDPCAARGALARQVLQLDVGSTGELRAAEGADQLPPHLARRAARQAVGDRVGELLRE